MDVLSKILGGQARVKIMRLFLLNKNNTFSNKDIASRSRVSADTLRRELRTLSSIDFIKKGAKGWYFNFAFKYTREFESLLVGANTLEPDALVTNFKKQGKLKLLVVSGVFLKNKDSRVDLLLVGDKLKRSKIEEEVRKLEAEFGAELVYAIFETKEFMYRLNMYDKLVRDILDFPHEIVFQAKDLSTQALKKY